MKKTKTKYELIFVRGGYHSCTVMQSSTGRYTYLYHDSGAKSRWRDVIKQLNAGEPNLNYVTSGDDYLPVTKYEVKK